MTWDSKELGTARRTTQQRFRINLEQLEFFSPEHLTALSKYSEEEEEYLCFKDGFASELLGCLSDHLSISDLKQIVNVFGKELEKREERRKKFQEETKARIAEKNNHSE